MARNKSILDVGVLRYKGLGVLLGPEDDLSSRQVRQRPAHQNLSLLFVASSQGQVGGSVRSSPGGHVLHIAVLEDVVRPQARSDVLLTLRHHTAS